MRTLFENLEVISTTKVKLTTCQDKTVQDRKEPVCYIHLKEVGGANKAKNEFWAKMYGDNALLIFKPGQKVNVNLTFHVRKDSGKFSQVVTVEKISLVREIKDVVKYPWDEDFWMPWDN